LSHAQPPGQIGNSSEASSRPGQPAMAKAGTCLGAATTYREGAWIEDVTSQVLLPKSRPT
jgi:hypothetical protein